MWRHYTIIFMSGNQLNYENIFLWFLSPWAKDVLGLWNNVNIPSVWFTHSAISLQIGCILSHMVRWLRNWSLGNTLIIIARQHYMGLSLITGCSWGTLVCRLGVGFGVLITCWLVSAAGSVCWMLGDSVATLGWAFDWG